MSLARWLLAIAAAAAFAAGCGGGDNNKRATPPPGRTIYAGEVGVLAPPSRTVAGPRLVLPADAVRVSGHFPLDSIVKFNVPIRNDGRRTLVIRKLDPG